MAGRPMRRAGTKKRTNAPRINFHDLYDAPYERSAATTNPASVTVHSGKLKMPLFDFINASPIIVGCVAWLTEPDIMRTLSGRFVALVVQKEAWWKKPDARGLKLAYGYAGLTGGLPAKAFPSPLDALGDTPLDPISCMGTTGGGNGYGNPLMHHKFLVRCEAGEDGKLHGTAVWTGSFNFSVNANSSFENAVVIEDPDIAEFYLREFAYVASLSEPMGWRHSPVTPRWKMFRKE